MDNEDAKIGHVAQSVIENATKLWICFDWDEWERDNSLYGSDQKLVDDIEVPGKRFATWDELWEMELEDLTRSLRVIC